MYWGFSESLNLYEIYKKHVSPDEECKELNILLFGSGDPRHIIKTIAKSHKYSNVKINFYMAEGILEILARNLLLLTAAIENSEAFSTNSKTHLFMDLYGNALTRPITHNYICSRARNFIKMLTDEDYAERHFPMFKYNLLRYRERDGLESICSFWMNKTANVFNISQYWEMRLRAYLKTRYDHRKGAFDWDLMMHLKDRGAMQICTQEYCYWRETGIAFSFPEFEYNAPNKTFASALVKNGTNYKHRGYVGDMMVGPFAAFGLHCQDQKMLTSNHGTNQYRATDVTFRNVYELIFEIDEKKEYEHDGIYSPAYGAAVIKNSKILKDREVEEISIQDYDAPVHFYENITVNLISLEEVLKLGDCRHFESKFDVVFVAQNHFPFINERFPKIFNSKCLTIFETRQISVHSKEDIAKFQEELKSYASGLKMEAITKFNINKPYAEIIYKFNIENKE